MPGVQQRWVSVNCLTLCLRYANDWDTGWKNQAEYQPPFSHLYLHSQTQSWMSNSVPQERLLQALGRHVIIPRNSVMAENWQTLERQELAQESRDNKAQVKSIHLNRPNSWNTFVWVDFAGLHKLESLKRKTNKQTNKQKQQLLSLLQPVHRVTVI